MSTQRRYQVVHRTTISYERPVRVSHNELRMTPVTEEGQTTLESRVRVKPMTWNQVYRDAFGTNVTAMEAATPHDELEIVASSTVEREIGEPPTGGASFEDLAEAEDSLCEYLAQTGRTEPNEQIVGLAETAREQGSPAATAAAVLDAVNEAMDYVPGVTGVHTNAGEAWADRKGVCQDFAHVALGALRAVGIPARYVSGYLVPGDDLAVGQATKGESHAWVEWYDGAWCPGDPTNRGSRPESYVVVARGRDYDDVPPFKGVFTGGGKATQDVEVSITRLA